MTQDNPATNPNDPLHPGDVPGHRAGKPAAKPPKKKRRWLRRIFLTLLILIIALVLLVALTPMMLSSGAGRNFVVGKINQNLNGHVSIEDWSIAWTGGIHADDVKVFDEAGRQILQIPKFSTDVSLVGAMKGEIHLGNTVIKGLDFFAERYPDGTLNFSRLAKSSPSSGNETPKRSASTSEKKESSKAPAVDGKVQLVECRGTFQNDIDEHTHKAVQFKTIEGNLNIPNINSTIDDSLKIVAEMDGKELGSFIVGGKLLIAKDNVMLAPGEMTIQQNIQLSTDLEMVQQGFGSAASITKFTRGKIKTNIDIAGDATALRIKPNIQGSDIALIADGVPDPIGNLLMAGEIVANYVPASASAPGKSFVEQIANVQFNDFRFLGVGSGIALNGPIDDPLHQRSFKNVTLALDYNAQMLVNAILPLLSKETRESLKDLKVAGNFTDKRRKIWTFNGPLPADKPLAEALAGFTANGEIGLDSLESSGATLTDLTIPFSIADGKLRLAYPKGAPKEFADAANLNGGKLSLAGVMVDLTGPVFTLSVPDKTKFLDNVSLNPLFSTTFLGGDLNNPLFSGADKASGQLSIEIAHCDKLPMDSSATLDIPTNKGVLELNLQIVKLELGSVLLAKLSQAMGPLKSLAGLAGSKFNLTTVHGDITDFNVLIQKGTSKQHLMMSVGDKHDRGLKLDGTVVLKTRMMDMALVLPMSTFGVKGGPDSDIRIPMSGPVNDPKLDASNAVKDALKHIKGIPDISGLLGKNDKPSTNPADQGKENPVDLLGNLLGKKKKDKKKDNPDGDPK